MDTSEMELFELPKNYRVTVIDTDEECEKHFEAVRSGQQGDVNTPTDHRSTLVFGLDAEWTPGDKENSHRVALLQLASEEECVLVRLHKLSSSSLPNALKSVLSDSCILKVGVGINADAKKLFVDYGLDVRGCVDLQTIAHHYQEAGYTREGTGLATLSKVILKRVLTKHHHIRCSDWEVPTLHPEQINYAACDAFVGYSIFVRLHQLHTKPNATPLEWCSELHMVDKYFKMRLTNTRKTKTNAASLTSTPQVKERKRPLRKTVLYSNCKMLGPDGELLCTCDKKKANWYLKRGLADLLAEEPYTIQLKFQPSGTGHSDPFFSSDKENKCVRCGRADGYCRHSIVPPCFRAYLPIEVKNHNSHDIVLLCDECANCADVRDEHLKTKRRLCEEFGVPLVSGSDKYETDKILLRVKAAGKALLMGVDIPEERRAVLLQVLSDHFQKASSDVSNDDIETAAKLKIRRPKDGYIDHAKEIVAKLNNDMNAIEVFIKRWRKHFLDELQPKHLPFNWSVDHPIPNRNPAKAHAVTSLSFEHLSIEQTEDQNRPFVNPTQ